MKTVNKKLLKVGDKAFELPIAEFETLAEAHASSGSEAATLAKLNSFVHAHQTFGDARAIIDEVVHEITKVPYLTVPVMKDGKQVVVDGKPATERDWAKDSEKAYVQRALAANPDKFDACQKEAARRAAGYTYKDEAGKEVVVPALATSLKVRPPSGPKVKKLPQKFLDLALEFLTGKRDLKKFNAAAKGVGVDPFTPDAKFAKDGVENQTALGWVCKAFYDAQDPFANTK